MRILATIWKELLTLLRDPGGLLLIFLMPVVMLTIMSLVQDAPFRDYTQFRFEIICVNDDQDSVGTWVIHALENSGSFIVTQRNEQGEKFTHELASRQVNEGRYKAALFIPADATKNVMKGTALSMQTLLAGFGLGDLPLRDSTLYSTTLLLVFDPVTKANFRQSVVFAVEKITANAQTKLLLSQLTAQMKNITGVTPTISNASPGFGNMIKVVEEHPYDQTILANLNSVQHNVPGWTMFAMFFILFPLAGNLIKEREDGSLLRMRLVAGSQVPYVIGKYLFHFLICLAQFFLMLQVGLYLLPALGLAKLQMGNQWGYILLAAIFLSFAATAFGLLVGVFFRTPHQALAFGSVSVVLLAALGGVWVPNYVMPPVVKTISNFTPMSWGMDLFNCIFLRHSAFSLLILPLIKLGAFAVACLAAALGIYYQRISK